MTHDFAKIRPEPILEKRPAEAPPAWTLLFTGLVTGLAIGVFACFLFYLSGNVPPLAPVTPAAATADEEAPSGESAAAGGPEVTETAPAQAEFELEFYKELPNYEVPVDPGAIEAGANVARSLAQEEQAGYLLQAGVFERRENAETQRGLLQNLGLQANIRERNSAARTLYLVQAGPFKGREQLARAESLLRANRINSIRLSLGEP